MTDLKAAAKEALTLAADDPSTAHLLGSKVTVAARSQRAWDVVCVAERALGVAAMQQSRLDDAIKHLGTAVAAGGRAGELECTAEARMSLASAFMLGGRPSRSFKQIGRALEDLDGLPAARALTQRAAILQELGRLDEALEDLRRALPVLRRARDAQWTTRALSNRGLLHTTRREFAAAESDLLTAQQICQEHDLRLPGAFVEHNLACVASQRGDVPTALRHFSVAAARFEDLGLPAGSLLTDRAELLLTVRLVEEARATAEGAVAADERDGRANHHPESELLLSTIAFVQGDPDAALSAADQAIRGFRRLGRREWLTLAQYARIQALVAGQRDVTPSQCRRAAAALEEAGWTVPSLDARLLAGRLALALGRRAEARRDFTSASRARRSGPADARARAWLAEAMLREADGRRRGAVAALRAGLRVLEEHRTTMGATELRAHVTVHRGEIARTGLRMAVQDGNARQALWWAESAKATSTLLRPVQPSDDPVLTDSLAELRAVMTEIEERRGAGLPASTLVRRQVALERRIRDHCRQQPGSADAWARRRGSLDDLREALGSTTLVEYADLEDQLYAVTVTPRRVRLHNLGSMSGIKQQVEYLSFALRRLADAAARPASVTAATTIVDRARAALDEALIRPLGVDVGDSPLVVVPAGALHSVPWSLLPSCTGRPVGVSPCAGLWEKAARRPLPHGGGVVVVAGPGLPGAQDEAGRVGRLYPCSRRLLGGEATARNVAKAMDGAALVHLAAHGRIRADNALFSSLVLADGPFTVYDLERLASAPYHVVLAACDTAQSALVGGGEILGFTAALMTGGTAAMVAPVVPVADVETVTLMERYHQELLRGRTPVEALAAAQQAMRGADHSARASAAGFVCLGYGERVLTSDVLVPDAATTDAPRPGVCSPDVLPPSMLAQAVVDPDAVAPVASATS